MFATQFASGCLFPPSLLSSGLCQVPPPLLLLEPLKGLRLLRCLQNWAYLVVEKEERKALVVKLNTDESAQANRSSFGGQNWHSLRGATSLCLN